MKRSRTEGSCPHVNVELSAVDYGNIILQHASQISPGATHTCCACGQIVTSRYGVGSEGTTTAGRMLRGCACGSVLLVDTARSELYCCSCRDYVYHPTFDEGRQLFHVTRRYIDRGLQPGLPQHDPGRDVRAKRAQSAKGAVLPMRQGDAASSPTPLGYTTATEPSQTKCEPVTLQVEIDTTTRCVRIDAACPGDQEDAAADGFPAGLRGLNNLGNTCFMNSVLQVFIHSPLMRNYFLGQGHSQSVCSRLSKSPGVPCLSCELDAVFAAAYSGDRAPLSPTDFLYSWWTFADSLAGYRQQDAHEFYLSALSGLTAALITEPAGPAHTSTSPTSAAGHPPARSTAPGAAESPGQEGPALVSPLSAAAATSCSQRLEGLGSPGLSVAVGSINPCGDHHAAFRPGYGGKSAAAVVAAAAVAVAAAPGISAAAPEAGPGSCIGRGLSLVDAVFGGMLRSDVTCSVCGHTSTAYDPFLDISLDMVAVVPGVPQVPYTLGNRPPLSESTPASSPTLVTKQGALDEDEADGACRGAAAAARPSASTCGGRSSLSVLSLPSTSHSPSGVTGAAVREAPEEQCGGEVDDAPQGRNQQGGCTSASTGSGSTPNGDDDDGQPHRRRTKTATTGEADGRSNGMSTASDNSCGPSSAHGAAELATVHTHRGGAAGVAGSPPSGSVPAETAAVAASCRHTTETPGLAGAEGPGGTAEAVEDAARTTSDSLAAAESAADGGGGGGGQAEAAASPCNPDDCITSPRVMARVGPPSGPYQQQRVGQVSSAAAANTAAVEKATATGSWRCGYEGACDPGVRGLTPGASASVVEDTTAGELQSPEEEGEVPLTQVSAVPLEGPESPVQWGGRRGGGTAGGPGRTTRGRGRGGRGRRGGAGGRGVSGGGGRQGVAVPQMGHPGAAASQMVDPQLTRPQGATNAEAGAGAQATQGTAGHATLHGCLRHFVTPERLSAGEAWVCSACKRRQPAVKQLSIRRLPPVLALHVKRFEHRHHHHHHHHHTNHQTQCHVDVEVVAGQLGTADSAALHGTAVGGQTYGGGASAAAAMPCRSGRHAARKIQTQLQFPVVLDLAPYTTPAILRERYCMRNDRAVPVVGNMCSAATAAAVKSEPSDGATAVTIYADGGTIGGDGGGELVTPNPSCRYQLFAVISHKGDLSGGHYVVFVRPGAGVGSGWYQCDDAWVTSVSEEDVTSCQAYMLFYSAEL